MKDATIRERPILPSRTRNAGLGDRLSGGPQSPPCLKNHLKRPNQNADTQAM